MTSKEFVLWLQGFTQGVHEYNITPKQWDALKDTLAKVNDEPTLTFPINTPNTAPNTQSFPTWQHPHLVNVPNLGPNNPFTVNGNPVSFGTTTIGTITTTPGGGSITYATPQFVTLTTSGTASGYPSGSVWNYTLTQTEPTPPTSGKQLLTENHD
jgi:hypothetical protein